jgi:TRAP transporter 4TM/12TM fusion protein
MFDKKNRMGLRKILNCLVAGAKGCIGVAMACSCAGIGVGIINYTGVGVRLSALLLTLSQNNLMLALVITAITALILGMGLPTTPSYIVVATLLVPAIIRMGVPVIAAHLFAFYFANISGITPPVALAAYTAASLAESDPMKTGYQAFFLGIASYIVPFMFVYNPILLLIGDNPVEMLLAVGTSVIGVMFLATAVEGYFNRKMRVYERLFLIAGALMLIYPGAKSDIIGITIGLIIIVPLYLSHKRMKKSASV